MIDTRELLLNTCKKKKKKKKKEIVSTTTTQYLTRFGKLYAYIHWQRQPKSITNYKDYNHPHKVSLNFHKS